MDFTISSYKSFLSSFKTKHNYFLNSINYFELIFSNDIVSVIILRHDVDRLPQNALKLAQIENSLGIQGSFYFRVVPESYDLEIMHKIAELGHEIGYHYEDVDLAVKRKKEKGKRIKDFKHDEIIDLAYESFCLNLEMFRKNFDVKTICMHGSPRSKYDNKMIWSHRDAFGRKYNYRDLGIIGEPYLDIDWNKFGYLTDTGRRWDGDNFSVRDKVESKFKFDFKTTKDIIDNIEKLPDKMMFTIHPQRWTDNYFLWTKELISQNCKNVIKKFFINK